MLLKAFEKLEELGPKSFSHNKDKKYFKLMQADCHDLPFEDNKFDTVVDILTL
jgi:ubiquinone/menaquinone biosynthesis C-methylase UbiE